MSGTSVKETARRQYANLLDQVARHAAGIRAPAEGWIRTARKALGMSAPQLARRMGVTKAAIYQAERQEDAGGVTLQYMERAAAALGGRFVYAIVPEDDVDTLMQTQARARARQIIGRAGAHMALEQQGLSEVQQNAAIEKLAGELLRQRPSDFWDE